MKKSPSRKSKPRANAVAGTPPKLPKDSFPVVGIGASAGGLEAFKQLLQHLSQDSGMGFVLVQHLAPKHESALPELLSRSIELPVVEVKDGMAVEPNHVYVIPPDTNMAIQDGCLRLVPRTDAPARHMPIDFFFFSLAAHRGNKAIGVILSGTGSDGTLGMKAIKAEGGITFAQDEQSAKYPGMPQAALAAGWVDFVLPPERIAAELERIGRHPYLSQAVAIEATELPAEEADPLRRIFVLIRSHSGVNFDLYRHTTIKRRVQRRMVLHKIDHLKDYARFLEQNPAELDALFQDILIHVTGFFRDAVTFDTLKGKVFPTLLAGRKPRTPLRIWVPGCSTGEEVYSLAISLLEFLGDQAHQYPLQIFATDISETAIEKARSGIYPENITAEVSPGRLQRFMARLDRGYQVSKTIRDACVFARHDLTKDPPFSCMDLISCRNVLIYLSPILQKKVLSYFGFALKPGGFLLLGNSENISGFEEYFAIVDKKHKIYSRKPSVGRPVFDFALSDFAHERARAERKGEEHGAGFDLQREVDRVLLSKYIPAGVVVNEDLHILQFRGRTGAYLEPSPGQASLTLTKMAREGLLIDLRAAIHEAKRVGKPARKAGIEITLDGRSQTVDIEVVPIKGTSPEELYFLVLFEEAAAAPPPESKKAVARGRARRARAEEKEITRLREELSQTKSTLQSIIEEQETTNEELRSANEEILSSNEELQSTNEELETAKEELQSSNEELTTLNEELQNRNVQLSVVNSDLNNFFENVNIPIVMVGSDLHIRRVTPIAEKIFNTIFSDIGRPLGNIRPNIQITDLEEFVRESIDTITARQREVQDQRGRWYSLRVRPYRTVENKIDGAVLVLMDIDALKSEVTELRLHAEAIVETVHTPLLLLDKYLRVRTANHAFYEYFRVQREETENRLIYDLGDGQWNIPRLRELLEDILPRKTVFKDFEVAHNFPRVGHKHMLLNARAFNEAGQRDSLILLAMEDITESKHITEALRVLAEVTTIASEAKDIQTMTFRCLETLCAMQEWDAGQVWLVDEQKNVLRCDANVAYFKTEAAAFRNASLNLLLKAGEILPGHVWKANPPLWISDLQAESNFTRKDAALGAGFKSACAFPIGTGQKPYAIWEFFSKEVREQDSHLLEAMAQLGNHLAVIWERKRAEESLSALSSRLIQVQDEERRRIARELHDGTAQTLAAAAMNISVVGEEANKLSPKASRLLGESTKLLSQISEEIRTVSHLLHPPLLEDAGLASALQWYVEGFARRSKIKVHLDLPGEMTRLPNEVETAIFRIVQEGLANIYRHSGSESAKIRLAVEPGEIVLEIEDQGKGLGIEIPDRPKDDVTGLGVGIAGMRERVKQLGGRLELNSSDDGTRLRAILPSPKPGFKEVSSQE